MNPQSVHLLDNDGLLVRYDDDSGQGDLSRLIGAVPADGNVNLAVTGHCDLLFEGDHAREGSYTLEVGSFPIGDANVDGCVNILDLGALASNYGAFGTTWEEADFNDDGLTNILDLGILSTHYGESSGGGGGVVPEPAALLLAATAAAGALRRRRSPRRQGR